MNGLAGLETLTRKLHVRGWSYPLRRMSFTIPGNRHHDGRTTQVTTCRTSTDAEERSNAEHPRCSATDNPNERKRRRSNRRIGKPSRGPTGGGKLSGQTTKHALQ